MNELFKALASHDLRQLRHVLAEGVDPGGRALPPSGFLPLQAAINELEDGGPIDALILLLRAGADPNAWDEDRDATPILMAVFRHNIEATRILLAAGSDPCIHGREGDTPLTYAAENSAYELARLLLLCGAERSIEAIGGFNGMSALGAAVFRLDAPMVQLLLEAGASTTSRDADRRTAVECLPEQSEENSMKHEETIRLLRKHSECQTQGGPTDR